MKKELVTVDMVDSLISKVDGKCHVAANMILTPGAKDELGRRRVLIVYDAVDKALCAPCAAAACSTDKPAAEPKSACQLPAGEDLAIALAAMIKKECGIEDPEKLRAATAEALKKLAAKL